MILEYIRFFSKRKFNIIVIVGLFVIQILQLLDGIETDNIFDTIIYTKGLNIFALFLGPLYCFWNNSAYILVSDPQFVIRSGSPFLSTAKYVLFCVYHSFIYVILSNIIVLIYSICLFSTINSFGFTLILFLLQIIFYVNCSLIYYILTIISHERHYLGFLGIVLYSLLDYLGESLVPYGQWINISTAFVVCYPDMLIYPVKFLSNFSILAGTLVFLYIISAFITEKKDYVNWGKVHG